MTKVFRSANVEEISFAASVLKTRELPLTVYRGLQLRLTFTHTNAASPDLDVKNVCDMIKRLSIVINGQDTLISMAGYDLYALNFYDSGVSPMQSIDTTASTAGLTSYVDLYLPFALTRAVNPEDTLLDVRGASSVVLEIQWGSTMGTNVTITAGTLGITTLEYDNVDPAAKFARHEFSKNIHTLTATGTRIEKAAVGSNNQYRRIMLLTKNSSGVAADTILSKIAVRSRTYYWQQVAASAIKARNQMSYAVTPLTGVYVLDFTTDGKMVQRIDARPLPELIIEMESLVSSGEVEILFEKAIYA